MKKINNQQKITFDFCLSKILIGEKIKILCNKQIYNDFMKYNHQGFIDENNKITFLDLNGIIEVKPKIKNIYLLSKK